jgi:hypothetical protein
MLVGSELSGHPGIMVELLKSNDLVLISYLLHRLAEEGIAAQVFDEHTSAVEGSIGILPRRVMVEEGDLGPARGVLGKIALTNAG